MNIFYDDKQVFDLCDKTFHAGMIGLWTKSDAVTYFDDLRAAACEMNTTETRSARGTE